ncbi:MAG: type II toxin-antitoxin system HicB family antitoxin [Candidatus Omnitrophota bacterium]
MKTYAFPVVIEEDCFEDGRKAYRVSCKALQGCRTWGRTYEEALANIKDVIAMYIADMKVTGQPVPIDLSQGVVELTSPYVIVNL